MSVTTSNRLRLFWLNKFGVLRRGLTRSQNLRTCAGTPAFDIRKPHVLGRCWSSPGYHPLRAMNAFASFISMMLRKAARLSTARS